MDRRTTAARIWVSPELIPLASGDTAQLGVTGGVSDGGTPSQGTPSSSAS